MMRNQRVWVGKQSELPSDELEMWSEHSQLLNFEIVKDIESADWVFLKDLNLKNFFIMILKARGVPRIQLISEPRVVWPLNYLRLFYSRFQIRIFRCKATSTPIKGPRTITAMWDTHRRIPEEVFSAFEEKERLERAIIINAHKFSFVSGENYSLRRKCALLLEKVDIFGNHWSQGFFENSVGGLKALILACVSLQRLNLRQLPLMLNSRNNKKLGGKVESKIELMSKYKVALVIENSADDFSEKIWHAWFAGCVPVYVGPELEKYPIPPDLYIQSGGSVKEIETAIMNALSLDYRSFAQNLSGWLNSPETRARWSYENLVHAMYQELNSMVNGAQD